MPRVSQPRSWLLANESLGSFWDRQREGGRVREAVEADDSTVTVLRNRSLVYVAVGVGEGYLRWYPKQQNVRTSGNSPGIQSLKSGFEYAYFI